MKRYIKASQTDTSYHFDIIIEGGYDDSNEVAAATYSKSDHMFILPDGALPLADDKTPIDPNSPLATDYSDFVESITSLLEEYYDLHIYYKNDSVFLSNYFGILAKNSDGSLIFDFDFRLRIATHDRQTKTKASEQHKKEQAAELQKLTSKKLKPIVRSILVNDQRFDNYLDAFVFIDAEIERIVQILKRKAT